MNNINIGFTIDIPQIQDKGEDSAPLFEIVTNELGFIGVFDGMGGAGATTYTIDNKHFTGAYLASRITRDFTKKHLIELLNSKRNIEVEDLIFSLKEGIIFEMQSYIKENNLPLSKIKGKSIRTMPTTMSIIYFANLEKGITVLNIWAGDSRCFSLNPENGLTQMSKDDLMNAQNPFENLKNDSPISNCINADGNFELNNTTKFFKSPLILITATDGAFSYFQNPIYFEYFLLLSLTNSKNIEEWKDRLSIELKKHAQDDITLSLVAIGFSSFTELLRSFYKRWIKIKSEYQKIERKYEQYNSYKNKMSITEKELEDLNLSVWEEYRKNYENYITQG